MPDIQGEFRTKAMQAISALEAKVQELYGAVENPDYVKAYNALVEISSHKSKGGELAKSTLENISEPKT